MGVPDVRAEIYKFPYDTLSNNVFSGGYYAAVLSRINSSRGGCLTISEINCRRPCHRRAPPSILIATETRPSPITRGDTRALMRNSSYADAQSTSLIVRENTGILSRAPFSPYYLRVYFINFDRMTDTPMNPNLSLWKDLIRWKMSISLSDICNSVKYISRAWRIIFFFHTTTRVAQQKKAGHLRHP